MKYASSLICSIQYGCLKQRKRSKRCYLWWNTQPAIMNLSWKCQYELGSCSVFCSCAAWSSWTDDGSVPAAKSESPTRQALPSRSGTSPEGRAQRGQDGSTESNRKPLRGLNSQHGPLEQSGEGPTDHGSNSLNLHSDVSHWDLIILPEHTYWDNFKSLPSCSAG